MKELVNIFAIRLRECQNPMNQNSPRGSRRTVTGGKRYNVGPPRQIYIKMIVGILHCPLCVDVVILVRCEYHISVAARLRHVIRKYLISVYCLFRIDVETGVGIQKGRVVHQLSEGSKHASIPHIMAKYKRVPITPVRSRSAVHEDTS